MTPENPYAPGTGPSSPELSDVDDAARRCLLALKRTRPWVRFIAILTAILAVFLGAVSAVALSAVGSGEVAHLSSVCISATFATLFGFAAKFLLFYAGAITRAEASLKLQDIASALELQQRFWKLIGASIACIVGLYVVLISIAFLVRAIASSL